MMMCAKLAKKGPNKFVFRERKRERERETFLFFTLFLLDRGDRDDYLP